MEKSLGRHQKFPFSATFLSTFASLSPTIGLTCFPLFSCHNTSRRLKCQHWLNCHALQYSYTAIQLYDAANLSCSTFLQFNCKTCFCEYFILAAGISWFAGQLGKRYFSACASTCVFRFFVSNWAPQQAHYLEGYLKKTGLNVSEITFENYQNQANYVSAWEFSSLM